MDMRPPGLCRRQALQHEGRATLTGHETVPPHVEGTRARTGRAQAEGAGLVIAQQAAQREAAVPGRDQHDVGQPGTYAPPAFAQGLQGRCAGRVDGQGLAMTMGETRQGPGGGIGQPAHAQRRGILRGQARLAGDVQHGPHGRDDLRTDRQARFQPGIAQGTQARKDSHPAAPVQVMTMPPAFELLPGLVLAPVFCRADGKPFQSAGGPEGITALAQAAGHAVQIMAQRRAAARTADDDPLRHGHQAPCRVASRACSTQRAMSPRVRGDCRAMPSASV